MVNFKLVCFCILAILQLTLAGRIHHPTQWSSLAKEKFQKNILRKKPKENSETTKTFLECAHLTIQDITSKYGTYKQQLENQNKATIYYDLYHFLEGKKCLRSEEFIQVKKLFKKENDRNCYGEVAKLMNLVTKIYRHQFENKNIQFTEEMGRQEKIQMIEKELSVDKFEFISVDVAHVSEKCKVQLKGYKENEIEVKELF